jgi:hypothetical protein
MIDFVIIMLLRYIIIGIISIQTIVSVTVIIIKVVCRTLWNKLPPCLIRLHRNICRRERVESSHIPHAL